MPSILHGCHVVIPLYAMEHKQKRPCTDDARAFLYLSHDRIKATEAILDAFAA
jgi:hypothetical protein